MPNDAYERLQIRSPHPLAGFLLGDRATRERNAGFSQLQEDLTSLLQALAAYVRLRCGPAVVR